MRLFTRSVATAVALLALGACKADPPAPAPAPAPTAAPADVASPPPAPAPAAPAADAAASPAPPAAPTPPAGTRAQGSVPTEPGTGPQVTVTDADREEMAKVFTGFAAAAGTRDLAAMKPFVTQRLGTSLEGAVTRHAERLFTRTGLFTEGAKTGVTVRDPRDANAGNVDVEVVFGNGQSVRVLFFKEEGAWRLNRL